MKNVCNRRKLSSSQNTVFLLFVSLSLELVVCTSGPEGLHCSVKRVYHDAVKPHTFPDSDVTDDVKALNQLIHHIHGVHKGGDFLEKCIFTDFLKSI